MYTKKLVIVIGPTAVGKTDFALKLAPEINGQIINGDLGQLYAPFSIGTAKPDFSDPLVSAVKHHLFDILTEPVFYTTHQFACCARQVIEAVWQQNGTPMVVGGSGFYIESLLFPPKTMQENKLSIAIEPKREEGVFVTGCTTPQNEHHMIDKNSGNWQHLYTIDKERAQMIHPNDTYRIVRALDFYYQTGKRPSQNMPEFVPFYDELLIYSCMRSREDLRNRIELRTQQMLDAWIDEVIALPTDWQSFIKEKKRFIGYDDILSYIHKTITKEELFACIVQKTCQYAKRQRTFFSRFENKVAAQALKSGIPCSIEHVYL